MTRHRNRGPRSRYERHTSSILKRRVAMVAVRAGYHSKSNQTKTGRFDILALLSHPGDVPLLSKGGTMRIELCPNGGNGRDSSTFSSSRWLWDLRCWQRSLFVRPKMHHPAWLPPLRCNSQEPADNQPTGPTIMSRSPTGVARHLPSKPPSASARRRTPLPLPFRSKPAGNRRRN